MNSTLISLQSEEQSDPIIEVPRNHQTTSDDSSDNNNRDEYLDSKLHTIEENAVTTTEEGTNPYEKAKELLNLFPGLTGATDENDDQLIIKNDISINEQILEKLNLFMSESL